jgi:putative ABC transport system permease protein
MGKARVRMGSLMPQRIASFFRNLLHRNVVEQALDDELLSAVELLTQEKVKRGFSPAEARRQAVLELGGVEQVKAEVRAGRSGIFLETFAQDLRYTLRILRKSPGFTVVAVLTLGLAIGANTALFSVAKGILLNTLPYRDPNGLITLAEGDADRSDPTNVSYGEVEDWKARSAPFTQIALSKGWTPALSTGGHSEITYGLRVTRNFFDLLGVSPAVGRFFLPEEDRPGRWHVVVLSHPYWIRRFAGSPEVIGKTVLLNEIPSQIVGVLPQNFQPLSFTDAGSAPDIWAPLGYDLSIPESGRSWQHLHAVARLQDGVSIGQARAQMDTITAQLIREFPKDYAEGAHVLIQPLREAWYGKVQSALWLLLAATGLVVLIACVNVTNLLLARGAQKNREVALRSALGATRSRIVRQLLTESTVIAVLSGVAGVLLAVWGTALLTKWAPQQIPRIEDVRVDPGVLVFALIISTAAGLLMGLLPALQAARADQRKAMQQTGRGVLGTRSRVRTMLVVSEVSLAFVLTVASVLLLKSFVRAWEVDPGFTSQNLYEVNFTLIGAKYDDDQAVVRVQTEVLERLRRIPGVESVSLASTPPGVGGFGGFDQAGFVIQDRHVPDPEVPSVDRYIVSPDYFGTTKIPLLRGRGFTEADSAGANQVAIISATTVRKMFPDEDPLGKQIQLGARRDAQPWAEIVGIVGDVHQYGPDAPVTPQAYVLYTHSPFNYGTVILVRSAVAPAALTQAIKEQIWGIDKSTMVFNPLLMSQVVADSLAPRRFTMSLLSGFGVLALILAALGIYGVLSYTVAQRTNEIGIRVALGAERRHVLRLVLNQGVLVIFAGLAIGVTASLLLTRFLASLLFGVTPTDPITFAGVAFLLAVVAMAACYIPARRAVRVDPMVALKYE